MKASPYVELHCHSYFSLLDGASSPETLVNHAAALEMPALALTDHDAVYGAPRFVRAARDAGIQPILGTELTLHDGSHLTLLVQNEQGWHNLCSLITTARNHAPKGEAALAPGILEQHTEGLIALSGCRQGAIVAALLAEDDTAALKKARELVHCFGKKQVWIELHHHLLPEDTRLNRQLVALAASVGIGCVATNNVHYAIRDQQALQDVLVCIRHHTTLDETTHLRPNSEYYLKPGAELAPLFRHYPQALSNTLLIAEQCNFELHYGLQALPTFPTPNATLAADYLHQLCEAAIQRHGLPSEAERQLTYELAIIEDSGLSNYFLIVWDMVRFYACQRYFMSGTWLRSQFFGRLPAGHLAS